MSRGVRVVIAGAAELERLAAEHNCEIPDVGANDAASSVTEQP